VIDQVHRKVSDHAFGGEGAAGEIASERNLLGLGELDGKADFGVAGKLGVLSGFDGVDGVPQGEAVVDPVGGAVGARISLWATPSLSR